MSVKFFTAVDALDAYPRIQPTERTRLLAERL